MLFLNLSLTLLSILLIYVGISIFKPSFKLAFPSIISPPLNESRIVVNVTAFIKVSELNGSQLVWMSSVQSINGVKVTLISQEGEVFVNYTDSGGKATFTVPIGTYMVKANVGKYIGELITDFEAESELVLVNYVIYIYEPLIMEIEAVDLDRNSVLSLGDEVSILYARGSIMHGVIGRKLLHEDLEDYFEFEEEFLDGFLYRGFFKVGKALSKSISLADLSEGRLIIYDAKVFISW